LAAAAAVCSLGVSSAQQKIDPAHKVQLTVYHQDRKTASTGIDNKDTGDAAGDAYFALKEVGKYRECREDPRSFDCQNPEVNSDDLVVTELLIEVDSRWGPYGMCNVDNSTGEYSCRCEQPEQPHPHNCSQALAQYCGSSRSSKIACKVCTYKNERALEYYGCTSSQEAAYCANTVEDVPGFLAAMKTAGLAADLATVRLPPGASAQCNSTLKSDCGKYQGSRYCDYCLEENKDDLHKAGCSEQDEENFCHKNYCNASVGHILADENLSVQRKPEQGRDPDYDFWNYNMAHKLGGNWYSTTTEGKCSLNGTGPCYWRVLQLVKRVSSNCQVGSVNKVVTKIGASCFSKCADPTNVTTTCWADCFFETSIGKGASTTTDTTGGMAAQELIDTWTAPFASEDASKGGCPGLPIPPLQYA